MAKKRLKKNKKLTNNDIGLPILDSSEIRLFLKKAGISEIDLQNPQNQNIVEEFVRKNVIVEVIKRESMEIGRAHV